MQDNTVSIEICNIIYIYIIKTRMIISLLCTCGGVETCFFFFLLMGPDLLRGSDHGS